MDEFGDALRSRVEDLVSMTKECLDFGEPLEACFPATTLARFKMEGHEYGMIIEVKVRKLN